MTINLSFRDSFLHKVSPLCVALIILSSCSNSQNNTPVLKLVRIEPDQSVPGILFGNPCVLVQATCGDISCIEQHWNVGIAVLIIENSTDSEMTIPLFHEYWKIVVVHPDGSTIALPIIDRGVSNRNPERHWPSSSIALQAHDSFSVILGINSAQCLSPEDFVFVECSVSGAIWKSNRLCLGQGLSFSHVKPSEVSSSTDKLEKIGPQKNSKTESIRSFPGLKGSRQFENIREKP